MGCTHDCGSCGHSCGTEPQDLTKKLNEMSRVQKVIGVVSGKGGVGKSLVTSLLAASMQRLVTPISSFIFSSHSRLPHHMVL